MATESEVTLKVGKKGEIFTSADLRKRTNIKEGGKVKATVVGNKLIVEAVPSIEEILKLPPIIRTTTKRSKEQANKTKRKKESMDDLLLDSSYLLPIFGVGLEYRDFELVFPKLADQYSIKYNPISLIEAQMVRFEADQEKESQ